MQQMNLNFKFESKLGMSFEYKFQGTRNSIGIKYNSPMVTARSAFLNEWPHMTCPWRQTCDWPVACGSFQVDYLQKQRHRRRTDRSIHQLSGCKMRFPGFIF